MTPTLDIFRREIQSLRGALDDWGFKTVRDDDIRERFRSLFRTWQYTIRPAISGYVREQGKLAKATAEIENLAKLASKIKPVSEYQKRLRLSSQILDDIAIYLPTDQDSEDRPPIPSLAELFVKAIPDLPASLVPNAIVGWRTQVEAFLEQHPFDRNVFVMVRYRQRNDVLLSSVKDALKTARLRAIVAREHNLTDDLYNPIACLLCCSQGVCIFDEPEAEQVFNPNVAYELGMMHLLSRRCLILKHVQLRILHSDILMKLYEEYETVDEAVGILREWTG